RAPPAPLFPYTTLFRSDRRERAGAIAAALRELAQRDERRLRRRKERRGPFESVARGVEVPERFFFGAEEQLAVVPQRIIGKARQDRKSTRLNSSHDQIS